MLPKSIEKENWRQTRHNLARQVNHILFYRQLSIVNVADQTGIPLHVLENITLGREIHRSGDLRRLAEFWEMKIKIELAE